MRAAKKKEGASLPLLSEEGAAAEWADPETLVPWDQNPRENDEAVSSIANSIKEFGFGAPIVARKKDRMIIAGHTRWKASMKLALKKVPVRFLDISAEKAKALALADNKLNELAGWDGEKLGEILSGFRAEDMDLSLLGWDASELSTLLGEAPSDAAEEGEGTPKLADRFGFPPFSVLDARRGPWQDRKRAWISLGVRSEEGRGSNLAFGDALDWQSRAENQPGSAKVKEARKKGKGSLAVAEGRDEDLLGYSQGATNLQGYKKRQEIQKAAEQKKSLGVLWKSLAVADPGFYTKKRAKEKQLGREITVEEFATKHYVAPDKGSLSGTSVFDPVLCEMGYRWFCPSGGTILDPFAGGSVRGVVAGRLGYRYVGNDLSKRQIEANRKQWAEIEAASPSGGIEPRWSNGDSRDLPKLVKNVEADLIFSCPPYADLEVYSDDPKDISTLGYTEFREAYFDIVAKACAMLKEDRFAIFVVGEVRDKKGNFLGFVPDTIEAFRRAGLSFYNEAILVSPLGSVPVRAPRAFETGRKLGKTHQNVLVFVKGDGKKAAEACGTIDMSGFAEAAQAWGGPDANS